MQGNSLTVRLQEQWCQGAESQKMKVDRDRGVWSLDAAGGGGEGDRVGRWLKVTCDEDSLEGHGEVEIRRRLVQCTACRWGDRMAETLKRQGND